MQPQRKKLQFIQKKVLSDPNVPMYPPDMPMHSLEQNTEEYASPYCMGDDGTNARCQDLAKLQNYFNEQQTINEKLLNQIIDASVTKSKSSLNNNATTVGKSDELG